MRQSAAVVVVVAAAVVGGVVLPATAGTLTLGVGGDDSSVGAVGGQPAPAAPSSTTADVAVQSDDGNVSAGERLSGVVGVQAEELGSEVAERRFVAALNNSPSDRGKARVVANQVADLQERLDRLEERRDRLRAALKNGSVSPGEFRARMAVLAANASATERALNTSAAAAGGLPEDVLNETGVNVTAIERLRQNASDLGGQGVAEIARSIGGPETGQALGPPEDRGPPAGIPGDDNETAGPPDDTPGAGGNETPGDGGPPDDTPGDGDDTPGDDTPSGDDDTPGGGDGAGDDTAGGGDGQSGGPP